MAKKKKISPTHLDGALPRRGGARPNAGRPKKMNREDFVQVTCILRKDTVDRLRAGAGGKQKFFGEFLQFHLDRFPLPSHEEYVAVKQRLPLYATIRRRRIPVIIARNHVRKIRRPKTKSESEKASELFRKEFVPV